MIQIRNSCFETNSSSSHSVCISMDGKENWEEIQSLIYDNTLHIYSRQEGFEDLKTNKCLDKLQFLESLICTDVTSTYGAKRIKQLRTRIKNIIGVSNVYLGDVDEYYKALKERRKKPFENEYDFKMFVRSFFKLHTLNDYKGYLESEIFESIETLRSFILSPGSWLYASSELSRDSDVRYYKFRSEMYCGLGEKDYDSIATVDYGGGPDNKVDVGLKLFDPFNDRSFKYSIKSMCSDIGLDETTGKLVVKPSYETVVGLIGDTYNLITLEPKEDFNDWDERDLCGDSICGYQKYKDNLVSEFSLPGYAKSYKACQVIIQSQEYLGDTII